MKYFKIKQRLILTFYIVLSSMSCFSQISVDSTLVSFGLYDCDFEDINGKKISVEINHYIANEYFGELKKSLVESEFCYKLFFNENNKLKRVISSSIGFTKDKIPTERIDTIDIVYEIDSSRFQKTYIGSNFWGEVNSKFLWKYDKNRNITEITSFQNENIKEKYILKYNEYNKLIERKYYRKTGELVSLNSYQYDKMGNQIESKYYGKTGELESHISYQYDKMGNHIESTERSIAMIVRDEKFFSYIKRKKIYDSLNNLIKEQSFDENDKINESIINKYNLKGKKTSSTTYYYNKIKAEETYNYDINDNIVKLEKRYFWDDVNSIHTFKYHQNGQLSEDIYIILTKNNEEVSRRHTKFNLTGSLIEETKLINRPSFNHEKPSKEVTTYEHDSKGNWIKKITYYVSPPTALPNRYSITERKINYR